MDNIFKNMTLQRRMIAAFVFMGDRAETAL